MKNKYYTPQIEEFHIGFEFEMHDTWGGWNKMVLTEDLFKNPLVPLGSGNERAPYYWKTRVKYLDTTDIKELGFIQKSENDIYITFEKDNITLLLDKTDVGKVIITKVVDGKHYGFFWGICKNKSELQRILNMVS